jgi:hypothetical protein
MGEKDTRVVDDKLSFGKRIGRGEWLGTRFD